MTLKKLLLFCPWGRIYL